MSNVCSLCKRNPITVALGEHDYCRTCAHAMIDDVSNEVEVKARKRAEYEARLAPVRARVRAEFKASPPREGVKDGVRGVYIGKMFLRGMRAAAFGHRVADAGLAATAL